MSSKTLCELKIILKKDVREYAQLVNRPRFVCKSCGRVANKKRLVCKPQKLSKLLK